MRAFSISTHGHVRKCSDNIMKSLAGTTLLLCLLLFLPLHVMAQDRPDMPVRNAQDSAVDTADTAHHAQVALTMPATDTLPGSLIVPLQNQSKQFNPNPMRAMWLSALCPGLGQVYNRRYWKLPIVIGAFVGLGYGTSWNGRMLADYTKAYRDIMDNDPNTKSYMDFFPSTVKESDLDMAWLKKSLKNKKDYYRRYRDICLFSIVGVYLLNVIDAYVDASLSHFDISDDLSMDWSPAIINQQHASRPGWGLQCAINF